MKLYSFYTPSHKVFFKNYLEPSASKEFDVVGFEDSNQYCKSSTYKETGWRATQISKVKYWIKCVKENYGLHIICSDCDIQLLGNVKEKLLYYLGDKDIGFQQNWLGGKICSGFFICKCCPKVLDFLTMTLNHLEKSLESDGEGGGEQYSMQYIIENKFLDISVVKLKFSEFWCPGAFYENPKDLDVPNDILVHHANWTHGKENKILQLDYVKELINSRRPKSYSHKKVEKPSIIPIPSSKPKVAVCLSSLLRNFKYSSKSLLRNVIDSLPPECDFFGHFPSVSQNKHNLSLLKELEKKFKNFNVTFERDPEVWPDLLEYTENMSLQRHGSKGNLLQWHSMKQCSEMVQSFEKKAGFNYDWIFWSRPDIYFFNELDNILSLDNKFLYLPGHDNHLQGFCDRFCIGNSYDMHNRMHIYEYFSTIWYDKFHEDEKSLTWSEFRQAFLWNPEVVLRDLISKELKLKTKTLNLCGGKVRDESFAYSPFWYSVFGNERTGIACDYDRVNYHVLNKLESLTHFKMFESSDWYAVNVEEIELPKANGELTTSTKSKNFLEKLLHKVQESKIAADVQ